MSSRGDDAARHHGPRARGARSSFSRPLAGAVRQHRERCSAAGDQQSPRSRAEPGEFLARSRDDSLSSRAGRAPPQDGRTAGLVSSGGRCSGREALLDAPRPRQGAACSPGRAPLHRVDRPSSRCSRKPRAAAARRSSCTRSRSPHPSIVLSVGGSPFPPSAIDRAPHILEPFLRAQNLLAGRRVGSATRSSSLTPARSGVREARAPQLHSSFGHPPAAAGRSGALLCVRGALERVGHVGAEWRLALLVGNSSARLAADRSRRVVARLATHPARWNGFWLTTNREACSAIRRNPHRAQRCHGSNRTTQHHTFI